MHFGVRSAALIAILTTTGVESTGASAQMTPGVSSDALPPDFRGRVTYRGTHEGVQERGRRGSREFGGSLTIELTFDGNAVTGTFSGTGGVNSGRMSGTRNGIQCRLFEERAGDIMEGECTRSRFSATVRSQGGRNPLTAQLEAQATQLVDARVEEQQRQVAAAQAAERQRAAEAAYAALPDAGPALTRRLDGYVQTDSRGWAFNRYVPGSMTDVKIIEGSVRSGNFVMRGNYLFNGSARGFVMAKMTGGQLECIQFWDAMIGCRQLRTPEQSQAMRSFAADAINSALSGGSGSNMSEQQRQNAEFQRTMDYNNEMRETYGPPR